MKILHKNFSATLDGELLGNSGLLRKLCTANGEVALEDPSLYQACACLASLPTRPEEFDEWMTAADYLCADPPGEIFLAATARAFRGFLKEISNAQYTAMTKEFWDRRNSRTFLLRAFNNTEAPGPDVPSYSDFVCARDGDVYACPWSLAQNGKDWARTLSVCERAWDFTQQKQNLVVGRSVWLRVRDLLHCVVLGFAEDLRTAPCVVMHIDRLLRFVNPEEARWMTRRAMARMRMAETNGKFLLGLDFVVALQRAYTSGRLDLNSLCFLMDVNMGSIQTRAVYLLPDVYGRCNVPTVETDVLRLRRSCEEKVPWLRALWTRLLARGARCFLAGSQLTAALLPEATKLLAPGDTDIFVTGQSELHGCLQDLLASVKETSPSAEIQTTQLLAAKFRVIVKAESCSAIDLYCHPLTHLSTYHMSAVRVAFDGVTLFCSPSCAAALSTSVSADINMTTSAERVREVVIRKWRSGFNLLVTPSEAAAFVEYVKGSAELLAYLAPETGQRVLFETERLVRSLQLRPWTDRDAAHLRACNSWRSRFILSDAEGAGGAGERAS